MSEGRQLIPMFPLNLFPLPGEYVPLHIFEPRYRQLLKDAEDEDVAFGICFHHTVNEKKLGALVRLESVIKKYPDGKSDIVVRCEGLFVLHTLMRTYGEKPYPGGWMEMMNLHIPSMGEDVIHEFNTYRTLRKFRREARNTGFFEIAIELNLDPIQRYKLLLASDDGKQQFLLNQLRYQVQLLVQEEKSRDVFHLN
jgi:Lon protease-like protein